MSAETDAYKNKRQKKATKAELLTEAEQKQADRQNLAVSSEGQVPPPPSTHAPTLINELPRRDQNLQILSYG